MIRISLLAIKPSMKKYENAFEALIQSIASVGGIAHKGFDVSVTDDRNNFVQHIEFTFIGVSLDDQPSVNLFQSLILQRLEEIDAPFYLHKLGYTPPLEDDSLFLESKLKPFRAKNARDISRIKELEVPQQYICDISGDIMDEPVYDVRNPDQKYDYKFLMHWLNCSDPKFFPHTKLPYHPAFLKTDFDLKIMITKFVKETLEKASKNELESLFKKYNITSTGFLNKLDQTLLNIVTVKENDGEIHQQYNLLVREGADVNCKDDIGETPLHKALTANNFSIALTLLNSGAQIVLRNRNNLSCWDLIQLIPNGQDKDKLLYTANKLGLIEVSGNQVMVVPKNIYTRDRSYIASPISIAGDAHERIVNATNHVLKNDTKRDELNAFEESIQNKNYGQALRRLCTMTEMDRVLPLTEVLLKEKENLKININEQKGEDLLAALHYAAKKVEVHGNRALYDLLVKHGADEHLKDKKDISGSQYLANSLSFKAPSPK